MASINKSSDPLDNFTNEQLSELIKSNDALDQEKARILKEEIEEERRRKAEKQPFRKFKKRPLEIINRPLFFIFIGSFIASFISIYADSRWWFFIYLISAFSCILYAPNRKALKELLDAWLNIEDCFKNRRFWR